MKSGGKTNKYFLDCIYVIFDIVRKY